MTTIEKELRKLFDHNRVFDSATFVGRTCYGRISSDLRMRAEFVTFDYADKYEALKVSIINKNKGVVDSAIFRFQEVLGEKSVVINDLNSTYKKIIDPHMWSYHGEALEWYKYQPTQTDFKLLKDAVDHYLEVFCEPVQEMSYGMEQKMS